MRIRLGGHPIHAMLVVFPLGLLTTSVIFDVIGLIGDGDDWYEISFALLAAGLVGALLAGSVGLLDWLAIPSDTHAKQIGLYHFMMVIVTDLLFGASFLLRLGDPEDPAILAILLSVLGLLFISGAGWFGGELVYKHGIGVLRSSDGEAAVHVEHE